MNLSDLRDVNVQVNKDMPYLEDKVLYGKDEYWESDQGKGDCEDHALTKMHKLLELGYPISTMRLCTCWTETGAYHCVLWVDFGGEDFVLDNRYDEIYQPNQKAYRWDKLQIAGTKDWMSCK